MIWAFPPQPDCRQAAAAVARGKQLPPATPLFRALPLGIGLGRSSLRSCAAESAGLTAVAPATLQSWLTRERASVTLLRGPFAYHPVPELVGLAQSGAVGLARTERGGRTERGHQSHALQRAARRADATDWKVARRRRDPSASEGNPQTPPNRSTRCQLQYHTRTGLPNMLVVRACARSFLFLPRSSTVSSAKRCSVTGVRERSP